MANHKRGKSKNQRAGCLMCKYWKINGYSKDKRGVNNWKTAWKQEAA